MASKQVREIVIKTSSQGAPQTARDLDRVTDRLKRLKMEAAKGGGVGGGILGGGQRGLLGGGGELLGGPAGSLLRGAGGIYAGLWAAGRARDFAQNATENATSFAQAKRNAMQMGASGPQAVGYAIGQAIPVVKDFNT